MPKCVHQTLLVRRSGGKLMLLASKIPKLLPSKAATYTPSIKSLINKPANLISKCTFWTYSCSSPQFHCLDSIFLERAQTLKKPLVLHFVPLNCERHAILTLANNSQLAAFNTCTVYANMKFDLDTSFISPTSKSQLHPSWVLMQHHRWFLVIIYNN